jgi:glutathione synthase/RimK-type ligase-like ATP-grasp enzyme
VHANGRSRVLLNGGALDPAAVWWWPGIPQFREQARSQSLTELVAPGQAVTSQVAQSLSVLLPEQAVSSQLAWALWATAAHTNALRGQFPGALWVSNPVALETARDKASQLPRAQAAGLRVPDTLQTSDPGVAREIIEAWRRDGDLVFKGPTNVWLTRPESDKRIPLYTHQIMDGQNLPYDGVSVAPTIFQRLITGTDYRVAVVADEVFAARVKRLPGPDLGPVHDYRAGGYELQDYTLSPQLRAACVALIKMLGLRLGVIDLIVDSTGTPWFLEVNPDGAWGAIELQTGQPIGAAIAKLLLSALHTTTSS